MGSFFAAPLILSVVLDHFFLRDTYFFSQAVTKYLCRALPYAHTHQQVKRNVRRILGLTDWYTSCLESMRFVDA